MALSVVVASAVLPEGMAGDGDIAAAYRSVRLDGAERWRGRWLAQQPRVSRSRVAQDGWEQIVATDIYAMPSDAPWNESPIVQPLAGTLASRVGGALVASGINSQTDDTSSQSRTSVPVPYRWSVNNFRYSSDVFGPVAAWNEQQAPASPVLGPLFTVVATGILPTGTLTEPTSIYRAFSGSLSSVQGQGSWLSQAPAVTVNSIGDELRQINAANVFSLASAASMSPSSIADAISRHIRDSLNTPLVDSGIRSSRWAVYALPYSVPTFGTRESWQSGGGMLSGAPPAPPQESADWPVAAKVGVSAAVGLALGGIFWYANRSR